MALIGTVTNVIYSSSVRPLLCAVGSLHCHRQSRNFLFAREKEIDRDWIAKLQNPADISIQSIKRALIERKECAIKDDQRFNELRYQVLGPDLATAHFVIHRGGAVKLVGHDHWFVKDQDGRVPLPGHKTPNLFIEGIDASGMNLMFHGLENFKNLERIKYLNLSDCPHVDDWCLDRLSWFRKTLIYLDISRCPQVTERGLPVLHRLEQLRRLHVSGLSGVRHKPLVAIMLEEALPNCIVEGIDYTDRTELDQIQSLSDLDADPLLKGLSNSMGEYKALTDKVSADTPRMESKLY